jgi:hypothetical protein
MRLPHFLVIASLVLIAPHLVRAQVAGSTLIGVTAAEMRDVVTGWSAKCLVRRSTTI